jgi:two-component system, NarL family, sensor histidine kinase UhpB
MVSKPASAAPRRVRTNAAWLPIVMQGAFNEIYVMDAVSLRIVHANQAARKNLRYSLAELARMRLDELAPALSDGKLETVLAPLRAGENAHADIDTLHRRKDGSLYPVQLRLHACPDSIPPVLIGIASDTTDRLALARALHSSDARFRAIVSNTPGLVYQFLQRNDGSVAFPYLSEGCHALLGVSADRLRADPSLFLELILPEDRASYQASMAASASRLKAWNWEGRIWIEKWKDIKWINLRSTPRALPDVGVQWEGMMTNITQGKLEQAEIKRSRAQLAELTAHVDTVKEQERKRISREIHDDVGGNLTAIKMALALVKKRLPQDDPVLGQRADYVNSLVDRTIEAIHRISADLRPGVLDFGIVSAIEWQAREFETQFGLPCRFSANKKEIALHADQATALFRIFQEALTNIGKHAGAQAVDVRLACSNRTVRLQVTDDGKGIANSERLKSKSFGIRGMVERAHALGGQLSVTNAPRGGTSVSVRIPLTADRKASA